MIETMAVSSSAANRASSMRFRIPSYDICVASRDRSRAFSSECMRTVCNSISEIRLACNWRFASKLVICPFLILREFATLARALSLSLSSCLPRSVICSAARHFGVLGGIATSNRFLEATLIGHRRSDLDATRGLCGQFSNLQGSPFTPSINPAFPAQEAFHLNFDQFTELQRGFFHVLFIFEGIELILCR